MKPFSRFNPLSYPLWLKITLALLAMTIAVLIPVALFTRAGSVEVAIQNARSFVSENGTRQLANVVNSLSQANSTIDNVLTRADTSRVLIGYLLGDVQTIQEVNLPSATRQEVLDVFNENFLGGSSALFQSVRLLDLDGEVLAQAGILTGQIGDDESQSPAFQSALNATAQERSGSLLILPGRLPSMELIEAVEWRNGEPLGFIIARINNARVFYNQLRFSGSNTTLPGYSFLASPQGVLFSLSSGREQAEASLQSLAFTRASAGQSGIDIYRLADGTEVAGYYSPVPGTTLGFFTQVDMQTAIDQVLAFFNVRSFIVAVSAVILLGLLALALNQLIAPALARLRSAIRAMSSGDYSVPIPDMRRGDEIGQLAGTFVAMRDQVQGLLQDQEARIAARVRDLGATQEISRYAVSERDPQVLMDRVVGLIATRFENIYHAQIFLINADESYAVLRASTNEPGRRLLERGHRLAIGSISVIGQVTESGRTIVARDTAASQVHRRNEFLPDTRAELAIPLRIGDRIIGALDAQSRESNAFTEDQIAVLETMADQLAVAIENARLYEESTQRAIDTEEGNRKATLRAWQDFMREQRTVGLVRSSGALAPAEIAPQLSDLRRTAITQRQAVVGKPTMRQTIPIALPIELRGQILGAVEWELPIATFGDDKVELAQELAARLAVSLDNARLFEESQRAAERERLVNSIAAKLTAQNSIEAILQTAVREVGQALRAPQVSIRLGGSTPALPAPEAAEMPIVVGNDNA